MQSEAVLAGLLLTGDYPLAVLIGVASTGNVLGSTVNWLLGRGVEHFGDRCRFPVGLGTLDRAGRWYRRYGQWSLLLSWMPVIGDPLTIAAGIMREPLARFLILVSIANIGCYLAVAANSMNWA